MILTRSSYEILLEEIPTWSGNYLEIGVWEGEMLRDFALRWPDKMFYGIDPFLSDCDTTDHCGVPVGEKLESNRIAAMESFNNIPNIKFFEQTSKSFMEEKSNYELEAMNLSVIYVDGSHTFVDTLIDLYLAARSMRHGLVYVDDFQLPEVSRAIESFVTVNSDRIHLHKGRRIILK